VSQVLSVLPIHRETLGVPGCSLPGESRLEAVITHAVKWRRELPALEESKDKLLNGCLHCRSTH